MQAALVCACDHLSRSQQELEIDARHAAIQVRKQLPGGSDEATQLRHERVVDAIETHEQVGCDSASFKIAASAVNFPANL